MYGPQLIDLGNPAADHPLNAGLVAWYLALPPAAGGSRLFDLTGRAPGTLVNGPGWATGPDGFAALTFNGSSSYADTGRTVSQMLGTPAGVTVSWWMRPASAHNSGATRAMWGATQGGGQPEFSGQVFSDNNWYVGFAAGGDDDRISFAATAANYPQGVWGYYTYTTTFGGASYLYRNGAEIGSKTTGACTQRSPSDTFTVGRQGSGAVAYFPGDLGGLRVQAAPVSASGAWGLWDQASRGYPDLLRRYTPRAWLVAPTSPPLAYTVPRITGFGW